MASAGILQNRPDLALRAGERQCGKAGNHGSIDTFYESVVQEESLWWTWLKTAAYQYRYLVLQQIKDRKYVAALLDEDYDVVNCYGIAFCGKECLVKVRKAIVGEDDGFQI